MIRPRTASNSTPLSMLKRDRVAGRASSRAAAGGDASQPLPPPARPLNATEFGPVPEEDSDLVTSSGSSEEVVESASVSFTYRKKRQERRAAQLLGARQSAQRRGLSLTLPGELDESQASCSVADDSTCVSGLSNGSGSTKGSRASAASRVSRASRASAGSRRPPHVREPDPKVQRHPLYLLKGARRRTEEVKFSGGMSPDQCAKFYKLRKLDYVVEKPRPQQQQGPRPAAARRPQPATPPATAAMSPAKRAMVERLRKMEARRRQQPQEVKMQQQPQDVPKEIGDTSDSTLSTIGLDESLGSLNDSQHSYGMCAPESGAASVKTRNTKASVASANSANSGVSTGSSSSCRPRFTIAFAPTVSVHRIPSAQTYPTKIYQAVWYTKLEWSVQKRVCRLELMADGSEWRTATEEGDYLQCPKSKKAVHPVHVRGLTEGRRRALGKNPMKLLSSSQPGAAKQKKGAKAA